MPFAARGRGDTEPIFFALSACFSSFKEPCFNCQGLDCFSCVLRGNQIPGFDRPFILQARARTQTHSSFKYTRIQKQTYEEFSWALINLCLCADGNIRIERERLCEVTIRFRTDHRQHCIYISGERWQLYKNPNPLWRILIYEQAKCHLSLFFHFLHLLLFLFTLPPSFASSNDDSRCGAPSAFTSSLSVHLNHFRNRRENGRETGREKDKLWTVWFNNRQTKQARGRQKARWRRWTAEWACGSLDPQERLMYLWYNRASRLSEKHVFLGSYRDLRVPRAN